MHFNRANRASGSYWNDMANDDFTIDGDMAHRLIFGTLVSHLNLVGGTTEFTGDFETVPVFRDGWLDF